MILVLAENGSAAIAAAEIANSIQTAYGLAYELIVVEANTEWNRTVEWDDLLIVVYNSPAAPAAFTNYIQAYLAAHTTGGPVIPVSTDPAHPIPPVPISGIKAAVYDGGPASMAGIVKAAGVFLGLALDPKRSKIFISYRAKDGKELAQALHDRLKSEGFVPWLDEADENLRTGDEVQDVIRKNIESAAMLLLIDTPESTDSNWVNIEIDLAIGQLLTVLPVVAGGERTSRFIQLQSLRRQALVKGGEEGALTDDDWKAVHSEIEQVMLSAFNRRRLLLSRARTVLSGNGFQWKVVDDDKRMYRADKKKPRNIQTNAFCHCLIHDITYLPALEAYWEYLDSYPEQKLLNQRICVYDRERVLSDAEFETIGRRLPNVNLILAHQSELETIAKGL
jgi:hypothetical protein